MLLRCICTLILALLTTVAPAQLRRRQADNVANILAAPIPVVADPQARLLEGLPFSSSLLNRAVRYSVYLPPDYYVSNRHYPVVYLLHGYSDDETAWVQFGEADRLLDAGIRAGELPPMIVIMPDAGVTWYMNDYRGNVRYEDMFVQEFVPFIDATYRTRPRPEYRALSGLSMGGHGSLLLAMHHPELFGTCAALSPAVYTDAEMATMDSTRYATRWAGLIGPGAGQERISLHWKRNSPLTLARSAPENDLRQVRWYVDCGDDDFLAIANNELHTALLTRRIPHEFRIRDGAHTWSYWRTGLPDALKFIGQRFHQ
jgi:enterochelin esterase-like enzyme